MAEQNNQTLQQAGQLLREGKKQEARITLVGYVRSNPSSTQGWWMLSFALTDPSQQIECVERVLRLDPNYTPASARLEKLKGNIQPVVSPFAESSPSQPAIIPIQPAKQNPPPPRQRPAQRPHKKTNNMILQFAVLGIMACVALGILGFAAVMIVRGVPSAPVQPVPSIVPTAITPMSLPPTWTPAATVTPIATQTLFPTSTPLATSTGFVLPTITKEKPKVGIAEGNSAPDFKLTNVNTGKKVRLSDYGGRSVLIFFWATWCSYCKMEMPDMQRLYQAYKDQGFVVLAVDVGESASQARKYRDANSLTFPILNDDGSDVSAKYRVTGFPTHFFLDSSGVITSVNVGAMNYMVLDALVRATLNSSP